MTNVYVVPLETEVPDLLGLDLIDEDNRFLKMAACANAADEHGYIRVSDGDLDFLAKFKLELPFNPILLTKIPGVKYSRHFLLSQTSFDNTSYDVLESAVNSRRQDDALAEDEMREKLKQVTQPSKSFRPPSRLVVKEPTSGEFQIEEA